MNKPIYLLLLLLICLLIPLGASAQQYTLTIISGDQQTGHPGQTLEPFVVEVRQNGSLVPAGVFVTFLHDRGGSSDVVVSTDTNGRAQSTLTLGRGVGVTTITASVRGGASVTFTATATIPTPPTPPPEPTRLVKISGEVLLAAPGDSLTFVVELQDLDGNPKPKVDVNFIFFGDATTGSLNPMSAETDADGRVQTTLTLTDDATGEYIVEAYNSDDFGVYVDFTVSVDTSPRTATRLAKISGDDQSGFTGEVLANPFVVEVRDQFDDPLEGVTVTFAVLTGSGALSATTAMTDANGQAASTLTLGSEPGANTVEISVEGVSETVVFSAEASLPPPAPTTLSIVSDDNQTGLTGETLADPFVVEVLDQYGNPISGVTVTITVLGDDGVLSTETTMTDANGRAEITLTLGTEPGGYTVEVGVEGVAETATFTVVAELLEFDLSLSAGLNLIHIPLKVRAVDGMAGRIESVADLYDALGGADTVNFLITHDPATQEWFGYFGHPDRGTLTDRGLTDPAGILASIKTPVSVRLGGDALGTDGMSAIPLNPGLNLVGLPLMDSRITRVSDLFALEGIVNNVAAIVVTDNGEFRLVGRAGGDGDIPITGGQGFILIVQGAAMVSIIGDVWDNTQ